MALYVKFEFTDMLYHGAGVTERLPLEGAGAKRLRELDHL